MRQWFWCGVFGEMYGGTTETRFANDVPDVLAWIDAGTNPGRSGFSVPGRTTAQSPHPQQRRLQGPLRARDEARGPRLPSGETIDLHTYVDDSVDVHHIFPKSWCERNGIPRGHADCIVNRTTIGARTNRRIGGRAPSSYLPRLENLEGIAADELDAILRSHDIDPMPLRADDFPAFFTARFERLLKQIEDATGKTVNRLADGSDNPYAADEAAGRHRRGGPTADGRW